MKSIFVTVFILLISNAYSYVPLFLAQKQLDTSPEKLIVQVTAVASTFLSDQQDDLFEYYKIMSTTEVKYVGATNSGLSKGDIINISYKTSKPLQPNASGLVGYMPIRIPETEDFCIVYLEKDSTKNNYKLDTYWALQPIVTCSDIERILSDNKTPDWVINGIKQLQNTGELANIK